MGVRLEHWLIPTAEHALYQPTDKQVGQRGNPQGNGRLLLARSGLGDCGRKQA